MKHNFYSNLVQVADRSFPAIYRTKPLKCKWLVETIITSFAVILIWTQVRSLQFGTRHSSPIRWSQYIVWVHETQWINSVHRYNSTNTWIKNQRIFQMCVWELLVGATWSTNMTSVLVDHDISFGQFKVS